MDLIKGLIYLRSRTPCSLDVRTHYVTLSVGLNSSCPPIDDRSQISVLQARMEASNDKGSLSLIDEQAAVAKAGEAPVHKILKDSLLMPGSFSKVTPRVLPAWVANFSALSKL